MANVKWSDDAVFVPQVSIADDDHVMGLTAGLVNAKYPGSLFFSALNKNTTLVYVSPLDGSNVTGDGTYYKPYQTIAFAENLIIDASEVKPYAIMVTGSCSEATRTVKPFVTVIGTCSLIRLNITNTVLDSSWSGGPANIKAGFENCSVNGAIDFNLVVPPTNGQFIINNCTLYGSIGGLNAVTFITVDTIVNSSVNIDNINYIRINSPNFGNVTLIAGISGTVSCNWINSAFFGNLSILCDNVLTINSVTSPIIGTFSIGGLNTSGLTFNHDAVSFKTGSISGSPTLTGIGTIDNIPIGQNFPGLGTFTTLLAQGGTFTTFETDEGLFNSSALFPATEVAYNSTSSITSNDLLQKTITCSNVGDIVLTLPDASDFDSKFTSPPPVHTAIEGITITNYSAAGTVTLGNGGNFTIGGSPNPIIAPLTTRFFKVRKSSATPAYIIYG